MRNTAGQAVLPPWPASRVTTADPEDTGPELPVLWLPVLWLPGDAITAMPPPRLNWVPGAGQTRVTEVTGTVRGAAGVEPSADRDGVPQASQRVEATQQDDHHGREQNPAAAQVPHQSPSPGSSAGSRPRVTCARLLE